MSVSQLQTTSAVPITPPIDSAFLNIDDIPWSPWVMEGTEFKLLNIQPATGGFTMMLKVSEDNHAPIHGHIGDVEGIITRGGFSYDDDDGHAGYYVHERGGVNHRPHTKAAGMEMFAIAHGPLCGYNDDGSIGGVVDAKLMYKMAKEAGNADHITPPPHWTDL